MARGRTSVDGRHEVDGAKPKRARLTQNGNSQVFYGVYPVVLFCRMLYIEMFKCSNIVLYCRLQVKLVGTLAILIVVLQSPTEISEGRQPEIVAEI